MEQTRQKSSKRVTVIILAAVVVLSAVLIAYYGVVSSNSVSVGDDAKAQALIVKLISDTGSNDVEILKTTLFESENGGKYYGVLYKTSDGYGAEIFKNHVLFKNRYVVDFGQNGAVDYSSVINCCYNSQDNISRSLVAFFGSNNDSRAVKADISFNDDYVASASFNEMSQEDFIYLCDITCEGQVDTATLKVYDGDGIVLKEESCGGSFEY